MKTINRVKLKLLLALSLALMAIVVILQNVEPVAVRLLFVTVTMPRAALLAITLLMGIFIGILISLGITGGRGGGKILEFDDSNR